MAGNENIGKFFADISANTGGLVAGLDKAAKAAEAIPARLGRAVAKISGTGLDKQVQLIGQAVEHLGGVANLSAQQVARLGAQLEKLKAQGANIPKALANLPTPGGRGQLGQVALPGLEAQAQSLAGQLGPAGAALGALGPAGLAAAAGIGAATFAIGSFVKLSGTLEDLSAQTSLSTDFLQELGFAGAASSVSMEEAAQAALLLSRNIGEGKDVFEKLGFELKDLQALSPDQQFRAVADAISKIQDPTQQTALALEAFGKSGAAILPLLRNGFSDAADQAHRLGAILDSETIKAGGRFDDAIDVSTALLKAWVAQLGAAAVQAALVGSEAKALADSLKDLPTVKVGLFTPPEAASPIGTGAAQKLLERGLDQETSKAKQAADAERDREQAIRKAEEALRQQLATEAASLKTIDDELAKRREQNETFGLLGKSADQASVDMGVLGLQVERFGGFSALSDTQLDKLVQDLEQLEALGGTDPLGTLNDALAETAKRAEELPKNKFGLRDLFTVIPESTGLWTRYGDVVEQELENAKGKTEEVAKDTEAWREKLQDVAGAATELTGIFNQLGVLSDQATAGLNQFVGAGTKGFEAFKDFASGNILGGLKEGLGSIGSLIGGIKDLFGKSEAEKVAEDVGRRLGVSISKGLSEEIGKDAERIGDDVAASLLHISQIIDEAGGVATFGFEKATAAAHDLFSQIETGKLSVQEAGAEFDKVFGQLLPDAIDETTGLAKQSFLDLIALNKRFGTESAQVAQFLAGQNEKLVSGLAAVAKGAVVSKDSAVGLGAAVLAAFRNLRDAGATPREALDQLSGTIADLQKKFKDAGVDGGGAFNTLAAQAALLKDEVAGPLLDAIGGAADAAVALANSGALTPEAFAGLNAAIGDTFAKLVEQGKGGGAALSLIAPDLQKIYELQQRFGFAVDDSTQKLLDQAQAAGLVGDAQKDAQERTVDGLDRVADILEAIAKKFGVDLPAAAEAGAAGVNRALGGIRVPDFGDLPFGGGGRGGGRFNIPEFAMGLDAGPMPHDGLAFLHENEVVLTPEQQRSGGGGISLNLGGIEVNVGGSVSDPRQLAELITVQIERQLAPGLISAIQRIQR